MQKIITTTLLIFSAFLLQAQGGEKEKVPFKDKIIPHFGFSLELLTMTQADNPSPLNFSYDFYTLGIGAYYVLEHANDRFSVGIDPTLQVGLQGFTGTIDWTIQAPVFLLGRYGAFSTPYNSQGFGVGAGIGFVGSYLSVRSLDGPGNALDFNQVYFIPSVMFEVSINPRSGPLTGRIHLPIGKPVYNGVTQAGIFEPVNYSQVGLGLVYGF